LFVRIANAEGESVQGATSVVDWEGRLYWREYCLGSNISDVSVSSQSVAGTAHGRHASVRFRVSAQSLGDPVAKSQGFLECAEQQVAIVNAPGMQGVPVDEELALLVKLTGLSERSRGDWKKWFSSNRDFLVWSDLQGRFVVDEEAKRENVPSATYRVTHAWPKGAP